MELYSVAASSTVEAGNWFQVVPRPSQDYVFVVVEITAGTATLSIEGRNDDGDTTAPDLETDITASGAYFLAAAPQMRVNVTAASGATIRVSVGARAIHDTGA